MFTKVSLVLIVALLVAILMNQRSQQVVRAQGAIEYKVVDTGIYVTPDGKAATPSAIGAKYLNTQDALDDYGKAGWQLVTHSYAPSNRVEDERLIVMRK
jgi:hypothetical protein